MPAPPTPPHGSWPRRLHTALMPDYNRHATAYWWLAVLAGAAALGWSVAWLLQQPWAVWLQMAAGEVAIGALRTSKRWTSRLFSPAIGALSIATTGSLLQFALAALPCSAGPKTS